MMIEENVVSLISDVHVGIEWEGSKGKKSSDVKRRNKKGEVIKKDKKKEIHKRLMKVLSGEMKEMKKNEAWKPCS